MILSEAQNGLSFDPERDGVFALRATAVLFFLWGIYTCFSYNIVNLWQMRMVWSFPDFGFPWVYFQTKPSTDGPGHPSLILPLGMIPVVVTRVQGDESLVIPSDSGETSPCFLLQSQMTGHICDQEMSLLQSLIRQGTSQQSHLTFQVDEF